jgi:hypothetical protein
MGEIIKNVLMAIDYLVQARLAHLRALSQARKNVGKMCELVSPER